MKNDKIVNLNIIGIKSEKLNVKIWLCDKTCDFVKITHFHYFYAYSKLCQFLLFTITISYFITYIALFFRICLVY